MKLLLRGCLVVLIYGSLAACGGKSSDPKPLVVGMEMSYPPFEMTDTVGKPAGVSVEIARALAEDLGRELVLEDIQFSGLIPALQTGRIDLIISSMTATKERAKSIDFSDPYLSTGLALLVQKSSDLQSASDLNANGRNVAVKVGTTGQAYAIKNLSAANIMVFDRAEAAVLEVVQGRADALIYDQMSIDQYARTNPETTRAILKPVNREQWAVALRKGNDELRGQVNAFLTRFKTEGNFERLGNKYLGETKASFEKQGVPFIF